MVLFSGSACVCQVGVYPVVKSIKRRTLVNGWNQASDDVHVSFRIQRSENHGDFLEPDSLCFASQTAVLLSLH